MKNLEITEKEKYQQIWNEYNYQSGTIKNFSKEVSTQFVDFYKLNNKFRPVVLDIGCGDGYSLLKLKDTADIYGQDITIDAALKNAIPFSRLIESPAWRIPFPDNFFDFTISCDTLEHIPTEKVQLTISEICRVTRIVTIHAISTVDAIKKYCGHKVHLTVEPIRWWHQLFYVYSQQFNNSFTLFNVKDLS